MITPNYSSYKDPVARVVKKQGEWYRYVFKSYQKEFEHLVGSGLYQELVEKGLMISHRELEIDDTDPGIHKLIRPEQIAFQSYPFEWSYSQWRKATLTFLEINTIALKYGMILKDATPFNFYLVRGKAALFDTSSFIFFSKNDPWIAYRQFCEEFLSPLALMHYNGVQWSGLTAAGTRGLQLPFVSRQLSFASWFNMTCLLQIHLQALLSNGASGQKAKKGLDNEQLLSLFSMMRSSVLSWDKPHGFKEAWSGYYDGGDENYLIEKEKIVAAWLERIKPGTVIDLGANTGRFTFLAAKYAGYVIGLDKDATCIDLIETEIEKKSTGNITALVTDLSAPTPGLGVLNKEYEPLFLRGRSDMVMGLALIHHLCISMNISLQQVAETFFAFTNEFAIAEFISPDDEKAMQLIENRGGLFTAYSEADFLEAFSVYFDLECEAESIGTKRKLFLFTKKSA